MKIFLVLIAIFLRSVSSQQHCQQVTVCNNENPRVMIKGEKGDEGMRGKAGPKGLKGDKGLQGEPCALGTFPETLMETITELLKTHLTPASCRLSSVNGKQILRSGDVVVCDNGWTVFQRRFAHNENFNRSWTEYKNGFGDLDEDFWFGLDNIHNLTRGQGCKLRIDVWDSTDDHSYAEYSDFYVEDESDSYRLHVVNYSGTAGNGLTATNAVLDKVRFSTRDRDNDESSSTHCASDYPGGWWFHSCFISHLNLQRSPLRWNRLDMAKSVMKVRCD